MTQTDQQTIPVGAMIDEFRVTRVLGAGNFGIVYECENVHLDETVAIKEFLPTELARRDADGQIAPLSPATADAFNWARDRFLQEARTLWSLARPVPHRNIVRVTRYREANGSAYMFMEFERGQPLSDLLEERGTLTFEELRPIVAPLLDGLERVHAANVLHRDIKPANILIRPDGSPVLIDFGAARNVALSGETSVFTTYTPRYAAMEQHYPGGDQGPWTDIYGLGATLYRAVTGVTPKSASEQLLGHIQEPAAELCRGRYPDAFLQAIDAACALKPEDRPQSVNAWRAQLLSDLPAAEDATVVLPTVSATEVTRFSASSAGTPRTPTSSQATGAVAVEAGLPPPRRIRVWILATLVLAVAAGASAWYWWTEHRSDEEAERAAIEGSSRQPEDAPLRTEPEPTSKDRDVAETKPAPIPAPAVEPFAPHQRFSDRLNSGGSGPSMIGIPAGEFAMGSPVDEDGRNSDERLHAAAVDEPFAMSRTEITIEQFSEFTRAVGYRTEADRESACLRIDDEGVELVADLSLSWEQPGYPVTREHPVVCVTWNDARAYAEWLGEQTGREYRLPTELEWEYAARATTTTSRHWGDNLEVSCDFANTADETVLTGAEETRRIEGARSECLDGHLYAAPVATFQPNLFGLHDMLGNVAEWTCSVYDPVYGGGQAKCLDATQRRGPAPIVIRGGSWLTSPALARSAARDGLPSNLGLNTIGFRVLATNRPWEGRASVTTHGSADE
ncbi:bifunctional serine/threonine-protein kinase/formylglycine-generating enzyme family protein [Thiocapsa rosea]|uniref:Formylglycine-generating enzyme required for sulfatase activity n=1 Tax=Thiocapsa rosea TaxID=69360 RepID=A0A495VD58_9GAMM|nr:bifunctional serine/threonine-protein kinase/formylglycine-generating enzyme family protein [Thiocapsa rosea]RKT46307.1 formylglycine-generating enzyme required for sulfatase activity [Thiocapsa rosea]